MINRKIKISLHNKKNKEQLLKELNNEQFNRITCSFYKYVKLENLNELRDKLYIELDNLNILGRVYLAEEGINAQISIPEFNLNKLKKILFSNPSFEGINIKKAIEDGLSFIKLTIKIKPEIVAYRVDKNDYDMGKVGKHLKSDEFNDLIDMGAVVVDMRNYYESEVGKFDSAIIPNVDKSNDLLPEVKKLLKGHENDKILMYCTGGIRCEKASSYLINHGFKDVNQLSGGIIQYAHDVNKQKLKSKFIGKNFVFDKRLGECITNKVISSCHQCGQKSNNHIDCNNQACHILLIQCNRCAEIYSKCCSFNCARFIKLPKEKQKKILMEGKIKFNGQKLKYFKPKLSKKK